MNKSDENLTKSNLKKQRLIVFVVALFIFIYMLRLLNYRNEIYVLHDEFAYWAIAAKYAGYDWSKMMVDSSYYSMGYSLLLVPIFKLGLDASIMYKTAIVINAIFIVCSYFIAFYIGKRIFDNINDMELVFLCGIISCMPFITMQTNYAWTEIFLYFLFWLETLFVYMFAETKKLKWCFTAIAGSIWMFFVHQRAIGIVIATVMVMCLLLFANYQSCNKKMIMKVFLFGFTMVLFYATFTYIKDYNLKNIFSQNDVVQMNDFSGQTSKIKAIFSLNGGINLFYSVVGKFFYFCISTLLVGPYVLLILIKEIIENIKSFKFKESPYFVKIFITLSFMGMLAISAIFMFIDYSQDTIKIRIDKVFYGRYFEFVLGPMMLIGINQLKNIRKEYRIALFTIIIFLVSAIITGNLVNKVVSIGKVDLSSPGFNFFFWTTNDYATAIFHGAVLICLIFALSGITTGIKFKGKEVLYVSMLIICTLWIWETQENDKIIKEREKENEKYVYSVLAYLEKNIGDEEIIYIYNPNEANRTKRYAFYIQYNLYQKEMQKIGVEDEAFEIQDNAVYIVMYDSSLNEKFKNEGIEIYRNDKIKLFKKGD